MRTRLGVAAALLLAGCQCGELPTEGAAKLSLSYSGFHPGCLKVTVWDTVAPATIVEQALDVPAGSREDLLVVAVYRQAGWSHTVGIRAAARERSCTGPEVAVASAEVTIAPKSISSVSLTLVANDVDRDDYVDEANGGTDCDDSSSSVYPGAVELCNAINDDCVGGVDDGFDAGTNCPAGFCGVWTCVSDGGQECSATGVPWYLDLDQDTHGRADAGSVVSCTNPDGGYAANNLDCDDTRAGVYPGAPELCDALDNDCNGITNEGLGVGVDCTSAGCPGTRACAGDGGVYCELPLSHLYYPDFDLDSYGAGDAGMVETCGRYGPDAGMSLAATDCDNLNPAIYPGAIEVCDAVDDNCTSGIDEGFNVGGPCDAGVGACQGAIACEVGGGTRCDAPLPVEYFFDDDMDTDGRPDSGTAWCSAPTAGWVDAGTDCDDGDPFTRPGKREICDGRDNNCNNQVDEGGGTCTGTPTWTVRTTDGGWVDDWETISVYGDGGTGVWMATAGTANNVLTKRAGAAPGELLRKSDCTGTWYGSWADPATGRAYLVGSNNRASYYDVEAANCVSTNASSSVTNPRGIVGYGEGSDALMYVAALDARNAVWDGGNSWSAFGTPGGTSFDDVHGISPDVMFAVGGNGTAPNNSPRIYRFNPASPGWSRDNALPSTQTAKLHSVWVVNDHLAYAVGSDPGTANVMLVWNGSTWENHPLPSSTPNNLTGVLAFGRSRVWIIDDDAANSDVWQYELDGGWTRVVSNAGESLRGIAGTSPEDLWIVGGNGTVIHWPE